MSLPSIAIINFSLHAGDQEVQDAIRAVNRQIVEDFVPIWGQGRILRLHASSFDPADPDTFPEEPVQADSVIYLVDQPTLPGALGYHDMNARGLPYGFVFLLNLADWATTLSHEALELISDPTVNIFVPGPDPRDPANVVLHAYENCDAVERTGYEIDGVLVSNFVTPHYFTFGDEPGTRNDFLGVGVTSFGVTRGSHIAFFDLSTFTWEVVYGRTDAPLIRQAGRAKMFDHAKPERPAEELLNDILLKYNKNPHPKGKGLCHLRGITRTARYQAAARGMRQPARS